jgi:hypothetical protein
MNFSANQGFAALLAGSSGAAKPTERLIAPAGGIWPVATQAKRLAEAK